MENKEVKHEDQFLWTTLKKCSEDTGGIPAYLLEIIYNQLFGTSWSYKQIYHLLASYHEQY